MDKNKKMGFKVLEKYLKGKYPYIVKIEPRMDIFEKYGTSVFVNIYFDLNKFYEYTNTTPPERWLEKPFLLDLLKNESGYLMGFVDDKYREEYGHKFNNKIEGALSQIYKNLPQHLRFSVYEGLDVEQMRQPEHLRDLINQWKEAKEGVGVNIANWIPMVDIDKVINMTN
jgi:hypothetical protein